MENNPYIFTVPGTDKKVNLYKLFELIENDYPDKLDKVDGMADIIEMVIRMLAWSINDETDIDELRHSLFTLFKLKDIFASMEVDETSLN